MLISCLAYSSVVKLKAACSYETSAHFQRTTWCHRPEDRTFHNHRCANLKSDNMGRVDVKLLGFITAQNGGGLPHSWSGRSTPGTQFRLGGPRAVLDVLAKRTFSVSVYNLARIVQPIAIVAYSYLVKTSRSIGQISNDFISKVSETVSASHQESHPQVTLLQQSMLADTPQPQTP
jgi:hypothetical protein